MSWRTSLLRQLGLDVVRRGETRKVRGGGVLQRREVCIVGLEP
jgi:hypothetical protein